MLSFPGGCTQRATILHPQPCTVCTRHGCIHFFHEHAQLPFGRVGGSRLLVRSRCWVPSNGRVRDLHSSRDRVVRHDGSTPPTTPAVCLALPAPHALTPACSLRCSCTRSLQPTDLSCSSARSPSLPADAVSVFDLISGWLHRRPPVRRHHGEQSDDPATLSYCAFLCRPLVVATASRPPCAKQWLPAGLFRMLEYVRRSKVTEMGGFLGGSAHVGKPSRSRVTDQ